MKKKERLTAGELIAQLEADPAFRARRDQQEATRRQREAFFAKAEAPVVASLRSQGLVVSSVWDLVNRQNDYGHLLPILMEHFQRPYPDKVREGIARAMAVPAAAPMWEALRQLFPTEPEETGPKSEVKWGLACALAAAFTMEHSKGLLELAMDPRNGRHRNAFIRRLARLPREEGVGVLSALAADDSTKYEAGKALARVLKRR